jgi:hypothetical protein
MAQPPSGGIPDPYALSSVRYGETLIWVGAVLGLIFGILLLVDYLNNRKFHHIVWAGSFGIMWIVFHQVIGYGGIDLLLDPLMSGMSALIPGLIAAGLLASVYEEKKFGMIYSLFALVMALVIALVKADAMQLLGGLEILGSVMVMILHIPSALIIIIIPILTTFKTKETKPVALLMSIGGILFGIVGILLVPIVVSIAPAIAALEAQIAALDPPGPVGPDPAAVAALEDQIVALQPLISFATAALPIIFIFVAICFAFGVLVTKEWSFEIPGIRFED